MKWRCECGRFIRAWHLWINTNLGVYEKSKNRQSYSLGCDVVIRPGPTWREIWTEMALKNCPGRVFMLPHWPVTGYGLPSEQEITLDEDYLSQIIFQKELRASGWTICPGARRINHTVMKRGLGSSAQHPWHWILQIFMQRFMCKLLLLEEVKSFNTSSSL